MSRDYLYILQIVEYIRRYNRLEFGKTRGENGHRGEKERKGNGRKTVGVWRDGSKLRWVWPIDRNHRSHRSDTDEALRVPDASVAAWKEIMADSRGQIRWTDTSHHLELVRCPCTREAFAFSRIGGFRLCIRLPCSHREDPCPLSLSLPPFSSFSSTFPPFLTLGWRAKKRAFSSKSLDRGRQLLPVYPFRSQR